MMTIVTGEVRFSYTNVFIPRANDNGGDPKYSVTLLIPKSDTNTCQALQDGVNGALQAGVVGTFGGLMPPRPAIPLYDGDGTRPNGEPFGAEAHGHWVITASSKQKPEVVDKNGQPILVQSDVYSGCYGRASVRFFTYNRAGKKGVGCGLGNVQKLRDGAPLGGGTTAAEDFGAPQQNTVQMSQPAPQINPITGLPYVPVSGVLGV